MGRSLHATWLGRVPYVDAWRLQEAVATRVRDGGTERLLLLEHDPVYTIGRRGTTDHLLVAPDVLRAAGASVYRVDRGGDITYHGPGQLVGYPITAFAEGADLVGYVRAIEEALRDALASYGVASRTERGKTGVWVDLPDGRPAKIGAIGVRVSRGSSCTVICPDASTVSMMNLSVNPFIIAVIAMNIVTEIVTPATQTSDCRRCASR